MQPRDLLAGNSSYQPGILSRDGWAIVDDTDTPRFSYQPPLWQGVAPWYAPPLASSGGAHTGMHAQRADLYFFGCGVQFRACMKDFVMLSGAVPLPPLATFGVWWSPGFITTRVMHV